ncbi:PREDICTED: NFAT activation molecule 1 isoform X2 [Chinchilla lanigera]|uniref:NFAT activation molecule 1 isoform X2 n=1 Tax=Chinchilla lanigera TaxID=34839 RepID=UPI000698E881|nr:PREDICTED: NFAT activation molecule 1 isoform X2 [Chinchilla lanigera]
MAPRLLALFLVPWTLQLTGGQSVTHSGFPIMVSLANTAASFGCRITYQYTPAFKVFTVSYFHIDLQGQKSPETQIACPPGPGKENDTYTLVCSVSLKLPDASATGTYYCCVRWPSTTVRSSGIFVLVRDMGYQRPPPSSRKPLLCGFTALLAVLSVLGTALLLWKKGLTQIGLKLAILLPQPSRMLGLQVCTTTPNCLPIFC